MHKNCSTHCEAMSDSCKIQPCTNQTKPTASGRGRSEAPFPRPSKAWIAGPQRWYFIRCLIVRALEIPSGARVVCDRKYGLFERAGRSPAASFPYFLSVPKRHAPRRNFLYPDNGTGKIPSLRTGRTHLRGATKKTTPF